MKTTLITTINSQYYVSGAVSHGEECGGKGNGDYIEEFKNTSEDEIIIHYIHKKFRLNDVLQQRPGARPEIGAESCGVIRAVKIKNGREVPDQLGGTEALPVRKSVIVRREEARTELEIQTDQIMISLNVEQLEVLFTQEEEHFFQHSLDNFATNWRAISQGSKVMTEYSLFCQNPYPLSQRFMKLLTGQLR